MSLDSMVSKEVKRLQSAERALATLQAAVREYLEAGDRVLGVDDINEARLRMDKWTEAEHKLRALVSTREEGK